MVDVFVVTLLSVLLSIQVSKERSMPLNQQFRLEGKNCANLCGVHLESKFLKKLWCCIGGRV